MSAEVLLFGAGKTLVVSNVTITDDSATYVGSFSTSLSSVNMNYTVTGNVVWEQTGAEKFRPSGTRTRSNAGTTTSPSVAHAKS